ncbi:DALR anticodon-binding domain-containing protein 3 [Plodia interpunctella]|uniref:DALR anticodon-binding domain-containing protein 3 n=1 Tax=Plodia interpunctella TaxID=58824 RepID=UPI002368830B|nr:DALR anticodon-binding domain-containing protein 3 [Plodia interpunctella]
MEQYTIQSFSENIFNYVTGSVNIGRGLLIKKHMENLQTHGDFSFPNTLKSWHKYVKLGTNTEKNISLMTYIGKDVQDLINESRNWVLEVKSAKEVKERIFLFLERSKAIRVGLTEGLKINEIIAKRITEKSSGICCDPECDSLNCLTSLRLKYLCSVVQNLCSIHTKCRKETSNIIMTSKSSSKSEKSRVILCGAVLNAKTGSKETAVTAENFIRLRQEEMTLIAQHKYGVRAATDAKWKEFINHLGESAVAFELLQIRPNSAVKINFDCSSAGSSKGAAFVLYNCARLETIIRTFNSRVSEGSYPALPSSDDVDFSLLTQEDEWCLIFNFILGFPPMLANCVELTEKTCEFRPHQICSFLCSMVRVFSQYYRRVRILIEPRKHLLPVMFARIHMLQVLNDTLKTCLKILNIKSVSQMYFVLFSTIVVTLHLY